LENIWSVPRRAVPDRLLNEKACSFFETLVTLAYNLKRFHHLGMVFKRT